MQLPFHNDALLTPMTAIHMGYCHIIKMDADNHDVVKSIDVIHTGQGLCFRHSDAVDF